MLVENVQIEFEMDSGSPISAISVGYWKKRQELLKHKVHETNRVFQTYSGGTIIPVGIILKYIKSILKSILKHIKSKYGLQR